MMRNILAGLTAVSVLALAVPAMVHAADDDTVARAREMLRRTQEALRQAQSENAELARAKADAELKLQAVNQQLAVVQSGSKAAQSAQTSLRTQLLSAQGTQTQITQKLTGTEERLAIAIAKQSETAQQLTARESELTQVRQMLEQSKTANATCEDKNLKLYSYAEAALERYKSKGVWAALSQKEPVLGLKEVGVQNVVQEYRLKIASQKIKQ